MYTIRAKFEPFRGISLSELLGAVGVYVIWDAHAKARPTYIGEGNVLKRFTDHVERDGRAFPRPWNGYVAVITGSTRNVHKEESRAVERLLLDVASETDRKPTVNAHPGSASCVLRFCCDEVLRVAMTGCDPFVNPERSMVRSNEIKARSNGQDYQIEHTWRLRRLRPPAIKSGFWA